MLLDGINHIALVSKDVDRLRAFYTEVFDAEVGPTRPHGEEGGETMTTFRIGPHTEFNVVTIEGNTEPERQTPMWGRGRLDHFGLQAASAKDFETIRQRLVEHGASDGAVNDFGPVRSLFFRDPDGLEAEVVLPRTGGRRQA
jgi:catechol 2,3-dioxygenase-like lactoylglutathione lyase family enzyme